MTDERLLWPDLAKGLCIVLVVLHHVTKFYAPLMPDDIAPIGTTWQAVSAALKPIRMPLFFVVSGLFASGAIRRPWGDARRRLIGGYYLYVVWLVIFAVVYGFERTIDANRTDSPTDFLGELVWAATSMWFLFALVAYFVLAKTLRRLPAGWVIAVAALLSGATSYLPFDEANRVSVLFHFAFFAFGAYCPALVRRISEADLPVRTLAAAYVVGTAGLLLLDPPRSIQLVLLSVVGIPLGIAVTVRLSRCGAIAEPIAWLGRRTLRVYVLHMAILAALVHTPLTPALDSPAATLVATVLFPLLVTAGLVVCCLGMHAALVRLGLGCLFNLPDLPPAGALGPRHSRPSQDRLLALGPYPGR
ncbi:MAG: acyltransferase family protein [Nocardioides sp.]